MRDLNEEYGLGIKTLIFKELINEMMIIPEKFRPDPSTENI